MIKSIKSILLCLASAALLTVQEPATGVRPQQQTAAVHAPAKAKIDVAFPPDLHEFPANAVAGMRSDANKVKRNIPVAARQLEFR